MIVTLGKWFAVPDRVDELHLIHVLGRSAEHDGSRIRVKDMVGHVGLPSGEVCHLRSHKATAASVIAWIAFQDSSLSGARFGDDAQVASDDDDVGALLARAFAAEVGRLVATRGLLRRYARVAVSSGAIRGRILFDRFAAKAWDITSVPCEAFERVTNTALNRFLAAVTGMIGMNPVLRTGCGEHWHFLNDAVAGIEPRIDERILSGDFTFDRLDEPYRRACALGRLLLRFRGQGDTGGQRSFSFLIPVNSLFENTVVKAFRKAGYAVEPKFNMSCGKVHRLRDASLVGPAPDARFQGDVCVNVGGRRVVVDAKFKMELSPDCYYQVVTYCLLRGATEAVLVLPDCGEPQSTVTFISACAGEPRRILVHALHLATDGRTIADWANASVDMVRRFRTVVGVSVAERCDKPGVFQTVPITD